MARVYTSDAPRPPELTCAEERPTHLYRAYTNPGNGDLLLYVGISDRWERRMVQHGRHSQWFYEVTSLTLEPFCCRRHALEAEAQAIKAERPLWNVVHSTRREVGI